MRLSSSRLLQAVLLVAVVTFAAAGWIRVQRQAAFEERLRLEAAVAAVPLFSPAPDITLFDRQGNPVQLSSYRGRMVFVNFWATWCGPCKAEMPSLIALAQTLDPADVAFVSIAEDDSFPPLDAYLARNPLPFDVYRDRPPRVEDLFATTSYPTSFLIDRDGQALYRFNGAKDWMQPEILELFALERVDRR